MPPGNLNYSRYDVLAIYYQTEGRTDPTSQTLADFDAALFADNDATLVKYMTRAGIMPTDKSTRSTVLLYSRFGTGGLAQRVAAACTFYKFTNG